MKPLMLVLAAVWFILPYPAYAQNFEQTCPPSTSPVSPAVDTVADSGTGKVRATICADANGNFIVLPRALWFPQDGSSYSFPNSTLPFIAWEIAPNGTDLQVEHPGSGGSGRFHIDADFLVGPPGSATSSQSYNSFSADTEGSYYSGGALFNLWEWATSTTPASGTPINSRFNIYPIFTGACSGCTADFAIGGTGTNGQQGNPTTPTYDFLVNYSGTQYTLTLEQTPGAFTGNRTQWFADKPGPVGIAWRYTCTLVAGTCTVTTSQTIYPVGPICTANGTTAANARAVSVTANGSAWNVKITSVSGTDTQVVNIVCVENGET